MAAMAHRRATPPERRDLPTRSARDAVAARFDLHPSSLALLDQGVVHRIAARIRSGSDGAIGDSRLLQIGALCIDLAAHSVHVGDANIHLRGREYGLLTLLARNAGRVTSRDRLLRELWGTTRPDAVRSLYVHVCRLRAKLEQVDPASVRITTVVGVGYRLDGARPSGRASNSNA